MGDTRAYGNGDIDRYLKQKMAPQEMHDFEKALMDDPFLADAVDGYIASDPALAQKHLSDIETELRSEKEESPVVAFPRQKGLWLKVAAAVGVIATAGVLTYSLLT